MFSISSIYDSVVCDIVSGIGHAAIHREPTAETDAKDLATRLGGTPESFVKTS